MLQAAGTDGAGIGTGTSTGGGSALESLLIEESVIYASADYGPGIGSGMAVVVGGESRVTEATIQHSAIIATGKVSAGIGASNAVAGSSFCGSLTIVNSEVFADGDSGAGIGAAQSGGGTSYVNSIEIFDSDITADGDNTYPGIGGSSPMSYVGSVKVAGTSLHVAGSSGVESTDSVTLGNGTDSSISLACMSRLKNDCIMSGSLRYRGVGFFNATTNTGRFFTGKWDAQSDFGGFDFWGQYQPASASDEFGTANVIHIGSVTGIREDVPLQLKWSGGSRTLQWFASMMSAFTLSVPTPGSYELYAGGQQLCHDSNEALFAVGGYGESFYGKVGKCGALSGGAIAGIVIGATAGLIIIVVLVWLVVKRIGHQREVPESMMDKLAEQQSYL
jgi:hypothetical protein